MKGYLKLVAVVVMAIWLAIPCQALSGHLDVLRESSPNSENEAITITIQIPPGFLRDQGSGEAIQPDVKSPSQRPEQTLRLPYSFDMPRSHARVLSLTVKFLLHTESSGGDLSFPGDNASQQNLELAVAISPRGEDLITGSPATGRPENGLVRTGRVVRPGSQSCSDGRDAGQVELTVVKSYPNPSTAPGIQLLERGPRNPQ